MNFIKLTKEEQLTILANVAEEKGIVEKPRDFDPFGQTGLSPLATI